jgi:large subunit ribosomal protein L13
MLTKSMRGEDVQPKWYLIDAKDMIVGRLATVIARYIRGKHKPYFTPHVNCGDKIVVINAKNVHLTGNKRKDSKFYWHTGYPGGIKERTMGQILDGRFPERVLEKAVERMIPKGPLGRDVMRNLRVYPGQDHPHEAQKLEILDVASMNTKNKRRSA